MSYTLRLWRWSGAGLHHNKTKQQKWRFLLPSQGNKRGCLVRYNFHVPDMHSAKNRSQYWASYQTNFMERVHDKVMKQGQDLEATELGMTEGKSIFDYGYRVVEPPWTSGIPICNKISRGIKYYMGFSSGIKAMRAFWLIDPLPSTYAPRRKLVKVKCLLLGKKGSVGKEVEKFVRRIFLFPLPFIIHLSSCPFPNLTQISPGDPASIPLDILLWNYGDV